MLPALSLEGAVPMMRTIAAILVLMAFLVPFVGVLLFALAFIGIVLGMTPVAAAAAVRSYGRHHRGPQSEGQLRHAFRHVRASARKAA